MGFRCLFYFLLFAYFHVYGLLPIRMGLSRTQVHPRTVSRASNSALVMRPVRKASRCESSRRRVSRMSSSVYLQNRSRSNIVMGIASGLPRCRGLPGMPWLVAFRHRQQGLWPECPLQPSISFKAGMSASRHPTCAKMQPQISRTHSLAVQLIDFQAIYQCFLNYYFFSEHL